MHVPEEADLDAMLKAVPEARRPDMRALRYLDDVIRRGEHVQNGLQAQAIDALVDASLDRNAELPPPLESLYFNYLERRHPSYRAQQEPAHVEYGRLINFLRNRGQDALQQRMKDVQTVILSARAAMAAVTVRHAEESSAVVKTKERPKPNPKEYLVQMSNALHGRGDHAVASVDSAIGIAEEALGDHPRDPKILFAAGGYHRMAAAAKGTMQEVRIWHLRHAETLLRRCADVLDVPPYRNVPEFQKMKVALVQLVQRVEEDLSQLFERG